MVSFLRNWSREVSSKAKICTPFAQSNISSEWQTSVDLPGVNKTPFLQDVLVIFEVGNVPALENESPRELATPAESAIVEAFVDSSASESLARGDNESIVRRSPASMTPRGPSHVSMNGLTATHFAGAVSPTFNAMKLPFTSSNEGIRCHCPRSASTRRYVE